MSRIETAFSPEVVAALDTLLSFGEREGLTYEQITELLQERSIELGEREHNEHMQELALLRG